MLDFDNQNNNPYIGKHRKDDEDGNAFEGMMWGILFGLIGWLLICGLLWICIR